MAQPVLSVKSKQPYFIKNVLDDKNLLDKSTLFSVTQKIYTVYVHTAADYAAVPVCTEIIHHRQAS